LQAWSPGSAVVRSTQRNQNIATIAIKNAAFPKYYFASRLPFIARGLAMAETTKLSVGQALEKLRGTDASKSKMSRFDEKIDALDEETRRLKAARRRIERDQRAGPTKRD
jgi:hypothetical protein